MEFSNDSINAGYANIGRIDLYGKKTLDDRIDCEDIRKLMKHSRFRKVLFPYVRYVRKVKPSIRSSMFQESKMIRRKASESAQDGNLYTYVFYDATISSKVNEAVSILKYYTGSEFVYLYLYDTILKKLFLSPAHTKYGRAHVARKIQKPPNLTSYVAMRKRYVMIEDTLQAYKIHFGGKDTFLQDGLLIKSALGVPILSSEENLIGVLECGKLWNDAGFTIDDMEWAVTIAGVIGGVIEQHQKLLTHQKQLIVHDCLCGLAKEYFLADINIESLLPKIARFTKFAVQAESVAYAVIDNNYSSLVGDYYEEISDQVNCTFQRQPKKVKLEESTSLMGWVANNVKEVNIIDTAKDGRISSKVDVQHFSVRKSILCCPLLVRQTIFGVLLLTNKTNGLWFNKYDENLVKLSSYYSSIAPPFRGFQAKLWKWVNKMNKQKEILFIHLRSCSHDFEDTIKVVTSGELPVGFLDFGWHKKLTDSEMLQYSLLMLLQTIKECRENVKAWALWLTIVKKCYRREIPYHNFAHAFFACHCMFNFLQRCENLFDEIEISALMVCSLCISLDHNGLNSFYHQIASTSFASLYYKSPTEMHHFKICSYLLQLVNLFPDYPPASFRELIKKLYTFFTSLPKAVFFTYSVKINNLLRKKSFNWKDNTHRSMVTGCMLGYACLATHFKLEKVARAFALTLYLELSEQSELELLHNLSRLTDSDINQLDQAPDSQLKFLQTFCLSAVEPLSRVLPNSESLLEATLTVIKYWEEEIANRSVKTWKPHLGVYPMPASQLNQALKVTNFSRYETEYRILQLNRLRTPEPRANIKLNIAPYNEHLWYTNIKCNTSDKI